MKEKMCLPCMCLGTSGAAAQQAYLVTVDFYCFVCTRQRLSHHHHAPDWSSNHSAQLQGPPLHLFLTWPSPYSRTMLAAGLLLSLPTCLWDLYFPQHNLTSPWSLYGMQLGKNSMPGSKHSNSSAFLCWSLFRFLILLLCYHIFHVITTARHMSLFFCFVLVWKGLRKGLRSFEWQIVIIFQYCTFIH